MRLAVASGKGGTGKTTIATHMAVIAAAADQTVIYLDCDVEEPNGALFLKPRITETTAVHKLVPTVAADLCTGCRACVDLCAYNALAWVDDKVLVFADLCHACGGCALVCPAGAIREQGRQIGAVRAGRAGGVDFVEGVLNIGESATAAVIAQVIARAGSSAQAGRGARAANAGLTIIDAPPGTSSPVIRAVRGCDYLLLVTEPTPFGLHDLTLAVDMARALGVPSGVVINRSGAHDHGIQEYCRRQRLEILATIPQDRDVAEAYAQGRMAADAVSGYSERIAALLQRVRREMAP